MTDLRTLSARVSEAEGPSQELDAEIWLSVDPRNTRKQWSYVHEATGRTCEVDETRDATRRLIIVPAYTDSLDAVAALIAEKLPPTWAWTLGKNLHHQTWGASVNNLNDEGAPYSVSWGGYSRSPALALLSATLLATHERKEP